MAKYGMSMLIAAVVITMLDERVRPENCRKPAIVTRESRTWSGKFFLDEDVLREEGVTDFAPKRSSPQARSCPTSSATRRTRPRRAPLAMRH